MSDQTVAQLHGLEHDDPWDHRTTCEKTRDAIRQTHLDALPAPVAPPVAFVDPPDDENLHIRTMPGRFYRLAVADVKLSQLLALEPSLPSIGLIARNTCAGCWVALTGLRVANQIAERLRAHSHTVALAQVSSDGQPMI